MEYTYSPPNDDGQMTVRWGNADAILKRNGKDARWSAAEMAKGEQLEYKWESHSFVTFKDDLKGTDQHHVFQLGPIIFDAASPSMPSYLLVAEAGAKEKKDNQWHAGSFRFMPLTVEEIRRQVEDSSRTDIWRCHFLTLLWAQPRPVTDAGRYILEFFNNAHYPVAVRSTAARSLLELRYAPARDALIAVALDSKADLSLRSRIVSALDLMLKPEEAPVLRAVAADASNPLQVRKMALESLGRMGEQGKTAIQQFTHDKDLKETARELLKEKGKAAN